MSSAPMSSPEDEVDSGRGKIQSHCQADGHLNNAGGGINRGPERVGRGRVGSEAQEAAIRKSCRKGYSQSGPCSVLEALTHLTGVE